MGIREELNEGCNNSWLIEIKEFKEVIRGITFFKNNNMSFLPNSQTFGYLKF